MENVKRALAFYGTAFGSYKNTTMTVVESEVPDGMEYDGLFFFGQEYFDDFKGSTQSYLVSLSAHETAHQWWCASVGNDPASEPWLDESLSTYSELLFYEHYYPTDVTWWWDYRINRFRPEGFVNMTIYDYQSFRPYINAVYLRGAEFLDIVRGQMGSNNFMSFLNGYAQLYAGRISTTRLFLDYLSSVSRFDLQLTRVAFFK
jgi:aminopeptidase N